MIAVLGEKKQTKPRSVPRNFQDLPDFPEISGKPENRDDGHQIQKEKDGHQHDAEPHDAEADAAQLAVAIAAEPQLPERGRHLQILY